MLKLSGRRPSDNYYANARNAAKCRHFWLKTPTHIRIAVMERPPTIKNEPKWIKDCTKIRARALELVEGKISLIEAALALEKLAIWTHAQSDPDLTLFKRITDDLSGLPTGSERSRWAAHALAREDVKIKAVVDKWQRRGLAAASNLVDRYAWSLDARSPSG